MSAAEALPIAALPPGEHAARLEILTWERTPDDIAAPEHVARIKKSYTGQALARVLDLDRAGKEFAPLELAGDSPGFHSAGSATK